MGLAGGRMRGMLPFGFGGQPLAGPGGEGCRLVEGDMTERLGRIDGSDWERPGRRSDGSSFTVASLVRYMIHDPIHHIWDVTLRAG